MKKILGFLAIAFVALSACTKDTVTSGKAPHVYPTYENSKRIASITGNNSKYGDYKWAFKYDDFNTLIEGLCTIGDNIEVEKITGSPSASRDLIVYSHVIREINLHTDEIPAFEESLKTELGEGNYSLKEELFRRQSDARTALSMRSIVYSDGRVYKTTYEYSEKEPLASEDINDFSTEYVKTKFLNTVNEYNEAGLVKILRVAEYLYTDQGTIQNNYKYDITYNGIQPVKMSVSELAGGENYSDKGIITLGYTNNILTTVDNMGTKYDYVYSNNVMTQTDVDGVVHTYTIDNEGYVVSYSNTLGETMTMTYESGHGDYSILIDPLNRMIGVPFIK